MNIVQSLVNYLTDSSSMNRNSAPRGICPNCWGNQEYDNVFRELYEDKQIDVNNQAANFSFVQDFVVNRITGITLIKGNNGLVCPTCHREHK